MVKFWRKLTEDIAKDPILIAAAACLSLMNLLTAYFWWNGNSFYAYTQRSSLATCHAFFPQCLNWMSFSPAVGRALLVLYALAAVISVGLILKKSTLRWGLMILAGATLFKLVIFLGRFNMLGNYHLIQFFLAFTFFFLPKKRASLTLVLILFYFLAGILKLNNEWLSGAALLKAPILSGKFLSLALAYVVVMELVLVWGLLARSRALRAVTLFQLICFHIFSWHVVGYYYPLVMFLALIPIALMLVPSYSLPPVDLKPPRSAVIFFCAVFVFNIAPIFSHEDPALEGRFRGLRVNMLDARSVCYPLISIETENEINFVDTNQSWALRTHCDPTMFETQLRQYCQSLDEKQKLNFFLYSKRSVESEFKLIRNLPNYCGGRHDAVL